MIMSHKSYNIVFSLVYEMTIETIVTHDLYRLKYFQYVCVSVCVCVPGMSGCVYVCVYVCVWGGGVNYQILDWGIFI